MTLNGIICIGYQRSSDGFIALLLETSKEQILGINTAELNIYADNNSVVETFTGFGKASKITEDLVQNRFEVFFPNEDAAQQRITSLEAENQQLRAVMETATQSITMLEECIVEMASVIYA